MTQELSGSAPEAQESLSVPEREVDVRLAAAHLLHTLFDRSAEYSPAPVLTGPEEGASGVVEDTAERVEEVPEAEDKDYQDSTKEADPELVWPYHGYQEELLTEGFLDMLSGDERMLWGAVLDPTGPSIREAVNELQTLGFTTDSPERLFKRLVYQAAKYLSSKPRIESTGSAADSPKQEPDEDLEWQKRAACKDDNPELFFPETNGRGATNEAKKVCLSCRVRKECLTHALDKPEKFGVWGGLTQRERRRKLKNRR